MTSRRHKSQRTSTRPRLLAVVGALSVIGGLLYLSPASAQAGRQLTVAPNEELTHGQYVDVSWIGFEPNRFVKILLCPANATASADCRVSSGSGREPGDEKIIRSGDIGTPTAGAGSTPFLLVANDVVPASGADPFLCDADHSCQLVAIQLQESGAEGSFSDSAAVVLKYALSTTPCPEGGSRIAGSGATSVRGAFREWQSEVCRGDMKLNVSYTTTNSVQGIEAFVSGLPDSDFALSGFGLSAEDRAKLQGREVAPVHVPITVGSLVLVYNFWYDRDADGKKEQVKDLRLSPSTAAKLMQGRIASWNDPDIAADNPHHSFPGRRSVPVARADNSAATWWLTSWLWDTARDDYKAGGVEFETGPTRIFPGKVGVILRTGTDAVAQYVRSFPGEQTDESGDVPFNGFIGYVYLSEAQKLGLPVAALKNAAGNYVLPTTENVTAAFAAGQVSSEGIFTPNFSTTDPKAYPIPVASYLIAASGESKGVNPSVAETIGKFVMYTNDAGQKASISRGYIPLPDSLKAAASAGVERVANVPAAELAPPSTAVESAPVATSVPPALAAGAPLTPVFATPDPSPSVPPSSGTPSAASRIADAVPAAANAIVESPPVQAIKRAIAGVLGLSDVGFVPLGMPTMLFGGLVLMIAARLVQMSKRRPGGASGLRSIFLGGIEERAPDSAQQLDVGDIMSFFGPPREDRP